METKNMSCFTWEELPSPARIEWFPWLVKESYWPLPFQHTKQCCSKRSGKSTGKLVGLGIYLKSLWIRSVKKEQCMSYAKIQPGASFNIGKLSQCLATLENSRILIWHQIEQTGAFWLRPAFWRIVFIPINILLSLFPCKTVVNLGHLPPGFQKL